MAGRRFTVFFVCIIMLFNLLVLVGQAEAEKHTVKIGYLKSLHFMEGDEDGAVKSGYAYEYMQKMSYYTGWDYEYVYGQWTDLMEKLRSGEIDMLAGVSITTERSAWMNFLNHPMGMEGYYIFTKDNGDDVKSDNYKYNLTGRTIGCVADSMQESYLMKWNKENGNPCQIISYKGNKDMWKAYDEGKIWGYATVDNNVSNSSGLVPVAFLGAEPYFLAIAKNRQDLVGEGNDALARLRVVDPFFNIKLHEKFFGDTAVMSMLTEAEKNSISKHEVIHVGYLKDYIPFSDTDTMGEPAGAVIDAIRMIADRFKLKINFHEYTDMKVMGEDLKQHKLDLMAPVYADAWTADCLDIIETGNLFDVTMNMIYLNEPISSSHDIIAVARNSPIQYYYAKRYYPDNPVIYCENLSECIWSVKIGSATATIVNSLVTNILIRGSSTLKTTELSGRGDFAVGLNKDDHELIGVLDKGIKSIGRQEIENLILKNTQLAYQFSIYDYLTARWQYIFITLLFIMSICVYIFARYSRKMKKKNLELESYKEKLEAALEKAKAGSKAKTSFLYNMSHDIRTPMNAILGFAELASRNVEADSKVAHYLNNIRNSGDSLLSLINNVLDVARIENGKVTLDESAYSINQATDAIRAMNSVVAEAKGLEFSLETEIYHDAVYMDHAKVQEIFLNLISNSIKYTPSGSVKVKFIQHINADNNICVLEGIVEDTGIGMSEEFQERLFDSFEREKNTTASGIQGTGLGMAIVKHLVELMNGSIQVESSLGHGTRITVRIQHRLADPELLGSREEKCEQENAIKDNHSGKTILLAEDNEFNAEIAMEILEEAGFKVEHAADGVICVDMLEKAEPGHFDVILMDVQMPNMDGLMATRTIRQLQDKAKAEIPIVAMTANAFSEDKENAFNAGMNGFISKPIELENLFSELERIL